MILRNYKEIDGIKIFDEKIDDNHADYNAAGLDNLYAEEEKHFWFIARKEFIFENFKRYIDQKSKIIEIGAGTGNVSRYLQHNGYENICVGEMHANGLKYAQSYGIKECYQFDLLDSPFENEFDAVCMFDVLEHIGDDDNALSNVHKILKHNGTVVLTVPAHMWLWNRDDAVAGHKRRYTKKQLIEKLKKNGFEVLCARYFFISIVPLLFLRRLLNSDNGKKVNNEEYAKSISMNKFLGNILLFITQIENRFNRFLPNLLGGSLLIMAKK